MAGFGPTSEDLALIGGKIIEHDLKLILLQRTFEATDEKEHAR